MVHGLGYFCYGIRGLIVGTLPQYYLTPFECMVQGFHITFFEIGEAASSWFTTCITIERLTAIVCPTLYQTIPLKYVWCVLGLVSMYTVSDVTVSWIGSSQLDHERSCEPRCGHPQSVPTYYFKWHTMQIIVCGYISIILYIASLLAMKTRRQKTAPSIDVTRIKREHVVTKRIALIVVTTFLLQILPLTIYSTQIGNEYVFHIIGPYVWAVYALTPSVNVFIYSSRSSEFRLTIKKVLFYHHGTHNDTHDSLA